MEGSITAFSGTALTVNVDYVGGSGTFATWNITNAGAVGTSGYSGYSGQNGSTGATGTSGYSGYSGSNGSTGTSGYSGYSGYSGINGATGATGTSGYSGYSGLGLSGYSGYSGIAGSSILGTNNTFTGNNTFSNSTVSNWVVQTNGGSLGGTAGNQVLLHQYQSSDANANYLQITETRTSAGTSWTTAGTRLQEKIDATWMAFIQFNGTNTNGGITFGTGTSATSATSISDRLYLDSSGNLYPATNNSYTLGSSSNYWSNVYATTYNGAGTGLTGTASSLSIGGNAATATTATNQSGGTVSATTITATGGITASTAPFFLNGQTVASNFTVPSGSNAMTVGKVTINTGVVVTVSTGSRWVVV